MYLSLESQSHNGVKYDGLVCTSHFLIAAIIGQILSLTWGKSSLPMVRNLTGEITNRKLSKLKMSNLAKFPLSCQTTVISKYPLFHKIPHNTDNSIIRPFTVPLFNSQRFIIFIYVYFSVFLNVFFQSISTKLKTQSSDLLLFRFSFVEDL